MDGPLQRWFETLVLSSYLLLSKPVEVISKRIKIETGLTEMLNFQGPAHQGTARVAMFDSAASEKPLGIVNDYGRVPDAIQVKVEAHGPSHAQHGQQLLGHALGQIIDVELHSVAHLCVFEFAGQSLLEMRWQSVVLQHLKFWKL